MKLSKRSAVLKIRRALRATGIDLKLFRNTRPLDFTSRHNLDAVSAIYLAQGRRVLLRTPLADCRSFRTLAFPCSKASQSPFIKTLIAYSSGECKSYDSSPLREFYKTYQPENSSKLLGLQNPENKQLLSNGPESVTLPWSKSTPEESAEEWKRTVETENREHGLRLKYLAGDNYFGPTSYAKGTLEYSRLINVYNQISSRGFKLDPYDVDNISAVCLWKDGEDPEARFLIVKGQHRVSALAALGHTHVDIEIMPHGLGGLIERKHAKFWPAVRAGTFTQAEAEAVFDRIFAGRQPESFERAIASSGNPPH